MRSTLASEPGRWQHHTGSTTIVGKAGLMTWTLWRGQEIIGEVHPRHTTHRQPGQVSGVLVPRPGIALPKSGSQHRIAIAGDSWVAETLHPDPDAPARSFAGGALEMHPTGRPSGVPPEEQLSVRSAEGVVPVHAVSAYEHRIHPRQPAEEIAALPAGAIVNGSVWLVSFWVQGDAPAS